MELSDLSELHYITDINNVDSILKIGILCNKEAEQLDHISIANSAVQERRAPKKVPGGLPLHNYVNLYISARNPMLYKLLNIQRNLCVLRINKDILLLPGVVISDGNAASNWTSFRPSPIGLNRINKNIIFERYWTDSDIIREWYKKRTMCAEVLIVDRVESKYIIGAYVSHLEVKTELRSIGFSLPINVNSYLFFR